MKEMLELACQSLPLCLRGKIWTCASKEEMDTNNFVSLIACPKLYLQTEFGIHAVNISKLITRQSFSISASFMAVTVLHNCHFTLFTGLLHQLLNGSDSRGTKYRNYA